MDTQKPCYLFFDFDGTVYTNHIISDETVSALTAVQAMGHQLIVSTGRSYGEALLSPVLFEIPWDGFVWGAGDIRYKGRELFEATVPLSDAEQWMLYCMRHRYDLVYGGHDRCLIFRFREHSAPFSEREISEYLATLHRESETNPLTKMTILQKPDARDLPKTEQNVILQHYADIFPKGCDKGNAIHRFCDGLGVPLVQCACFGDSLNDIAMFEVCSTGVCMKNSPDALIALATYHATTENGVAEGLRYLFGF